MNSEPLSEDTIAGIESLHVKATALIDDDTDPSIAALICHIPALCQTVRALRAEIAEWESHRDGIIEAVKTAEARVEELEEANTTLREQLAEAREYSDTLARNYTSLEDWILRIRIKLGLQAKDADIETAIDKFQSRLAQVEKERDEMRTQLRAAIPYVNGKRRQFRLLRHVGPYAEEQP